MAEPPCVVRSRFASYGFGGAFVLLLLTFTII